MRHNATALGKAPRLNQHRPLTTMHKPTTSIRPPRANALAATGHQSVTPRVAWVCLLTLGVALMACVTLARSQDTHNAIHALAPIVGVGEFDAIAVHPTLAISARVQARNSARFAAQVWA